MNFPRYSLRKWFTLLLHFTWQEAAACFFAVFILFMLMLTRYYPLPGLPRYDYMVLKMETVDELKVICLFHILGTTMELFKVHMGSWSYPGEAYSKLWGVPLYGGFMYASVASYITQAWRRLHLQLENFPAMWMNIVIGSLIYLNFFAHHFIYDIRYWLLMAVILAYACTL
jgi:uncharacterized membrane protein YoaT (DUF817 family)